MTGAKRRDKRCRLCGQPPRGGESLTHGGYHIGCSMRVAEEAAAQMAAKSGPHYEKWLRSAGPQGRNRYSDGGSRIPAGR